MPPITPEQEREAVATVKFWLDNAEYYAFPPELIESLRTLLQLLKEKDAEIERLTRGEYWVSHKELMKSTKPEAVECRGCDNHWPQFNSALIENKVSGKDELYPDEIWHRRIDQDEQGRMRSHFYLCTAHKER